MDANMCETTVDLIQGLTNKEGSYVWNDYKKYQNIDVNLRELKTKCQDNMLEYVKDLLLVQNKNVICSFSERNMA